MLAKYPPFEYYLPNMSRKFDLKKLEPDKIALLGMFALALFIANIIVSVKSAIIFSEPIELAHTGLSIPVPLGNGWQSDKKWDYEKNTFILSSYFTLDTDRPTVGAYYVYMLNAEKIGPQAFFEQKTTEIGGRILRTGQKQIKGLSIDWAQIEQPEFSFNSFLATAELPYNRRLSIEVRQIIGDIDMAEKVFNKILDSINFEDNRLFETGSAIVEAIRNKGLDNLMDEKNKQSYYMIKDSNRRNIGFMIDVLIDSQQNTDFNIKAAGHLYGENLREQAMLFQCTNNLEKFYWESETNDSSGRNLTSIALEKNGVMTVRQTVTQTESKYNLSSIAIPDIFITQLLNQIIESNTKQVIVDVIDADGKITPTIVSLLEEKDDITAGNQAAYTLKMESLDGRNFSKLVYLNNNRQIEKVISQQNKKEYIFEPTTRARIILEFPERAEFISQRNSMLEGNI